MLVLLYHVIRVFLDKKKKFSYLLAKLEPSSHFNAGKSKAVAHERYEHKGGGSAEIRTKATIQTNI
jgi:hypothetical protein